MISALVLSAGSSSRMKSSTPKGLIPVLFKPLISYTISTLRETNIDDIYVLIDNEHEQDYQSLDSNLKLIIQKNKFGTGNALKESISHINSNCLLVTNNDNPLISSETLNNFIDFFFNNDLDASLITFNTQNPSTYGRIINKEKLIIKEEKECTEEEKKIKEVNAGVYIFKISSILPILNNLKVDTLTKEIHITDIFLDMSLKIKPYQDESNINYLNINTPNDLSSLELALQQRINAYHINNGVRLINPSSILIEDAVTLEKDVIVYPNSIIKGNSYIEEGTIIQSSYIDSSYIKRNSIIKSSYVENSFVDENVGIGPFAHLRNHAHIEKNVRIGNYVEIKNSYIGEGSKLAHLVYVGDTICGNYVNFGCGVVTVNYDGKKKHRTRIGNHVFIGCNCALIAPISIGDNAFIAASSTLTDDVPSSSFSIARSHQVTKEDYSYKYGYFKKD